MSKLNWREIGVGAIVPVIVIALWQASAMFGWINPQVLPSPLAVAQKFVEYALPLQAYDPATQSWLAWALSGELWMDTVGSMYRVLVGFAVGAGLALPLGLLMGASPRVYAWINPLMQVLRPIPPIAYIPLSILWFGLGNAPAVFLIALGAFFPVLMNTIAGVRQVDGIYIRAARNLGVSQSTMFVRVMLPAAVPYILSGVRIGIGTAFIVVIVSEMIAVNNGLGFRILEAREYFWSDKIIAGMISIGILGLLIDIGMNKLNNHLLRWHRGLEN
ncbi:NitT/TauT family transport system permease protein [Pseudoduganella flava]|uniref:ABC transporter permease subunit n=1 Tax=Pseudoduganella flava TaxID=871742 RepID=A0A562PV24_9BURK|nr:ABC transporter permease [Pseudoduganella flava]QGZ39425.1 ABC transporter permease subunit [Pseudoduganella flava]TWI48301.1 NitT/TauT family transport system permease protein [Pseudoduganella flava]